jgi:hypothetical protein
MEVPSGDLHQKGGFGGQFLDADQARVAITAA